MSDVVDFPVKRCGECMKPTPYIYVLIRTDIPLADQMVQVGHVCVEAGKHYQHPPGTFMALLQVSNQEELNKAYQELTSAGIDIQIYSEPDDDMGYTALASGPVYGQERQFFKQYQLWRNPYETAQQQSQASSVQGVPLAHLSKSTPVKVVKTPNCLWKIFVGLTSNMPKN